MQASKNKHTTDFIIIGAGILGLSTALKLLDAYPNAKISILEKEGSVGEHASGRNSGVLHSGIYYPPESLKAKLCGEGARAMLAYCQEHHLPWNKLGKVIVPTRTEDEDTLRMLYERGLVNGVHVEWLDEAQLAELEPLARTATGRALFVPETTVVDPKAIMQHLHQTLAARGVNFYFNACCKQVLRIRLHLRCGISLPRNRQSRFTVLMQADIMLNSERNKLPIRVVRWNRPGHGIEPATVCPIMEGARQLILIGPAAHWFRSNLGSHWHSLV